ncbi:MAG: adenine deaminase [Chitinophagaceae bacterium]|nr:MAG: adenine deaminase [Chitinophagaceae bacterium]
MSLTTIKGRLVDAFAKRTYLAEISFENGIITGIIETGEDDGTPQPFVLPGFTDSHVHIESSMLVPSEFARLAVVHGTVATVSDPHEIANVCGLPGVEFMISNGNTVPFKFNFGAPSCVPATTFETAGASLDSGEVARLLARAEIRYLSEMMNFPGVLSGDGEVMKKIASAHQLGKPVDGHAPGLRGAEAQAYIDAGISTDHECFTADEALGKLQKGMKILIREGSAARNFEALIGLLSDHEDMIMFCSDDKHPDSLVLGHINQLCARAVAKGIDIYKIVKAACINPVLHYKLDVGLLRVGDPADFILVSDLDNFNVSQTWINGELVAENGKSFIRTTRPDSINQFSCEPINPTAIIYPKPDATEIPVIEALDGQLITTKYLQPVADLLDPSGANLQSNPSIDVLKIIVVNRYKPSPVAVAFIRNFGLTAGALASSVAHDSHNIVAVGADDKSLCRAVNNVIAATGGVSAVWGELEQLVALPVGGLLSNDDGYRVAEAYTSIDQLSKKMGSRLGSPFMTLSFMALLVIPHLKLSDLGLFDGDRFQLVD